MEEKCLAVITARGGSKRIPRKNIKEFCGRPIIEYSVKAALESGIFDEVMVSTDDAKIALIAKEAGAKVPFFRSEENSGFTLAFSFSASGKSSLTWLRKSCSMFFPCPMPLMPAQIL